MDPTRTGPEGGTSGTANKDLALNRSNSIHSDSTYGELDLTGHLEGSVEPERPALLARSDGVCLLYPGRVHAINAESESGKTWLALFSCAECMREGKHVIYLDFEDGPSGIVGRLRNLGIDPGVIRHLFHYVRPDESFDDVARIALTELIDLGPCPLSWCNSRRA